MKKAEIDEILMPADEAKTTENERHVRAGFWDKLRKTASRIPFMEDLIAAYYCALDPQTPSSVRATLLASIAYFILPLDMVPDFLVGFGLTDDIAVLTTAIASVKGHITDGHRNAAQAFLENENKTEVA